MKKVIIIILILLNSFLFALEKPVIAVPTIGGIEVPAFLAEVCRDLIESALIKTNKFTVINYNNIEEILDAQSFSLSGCVDDSCAVEIGKLLAAESIIIGTLSKVGEKMLLSIRLVNVSSGKGIRAEVITIDSEDDLQEKSFEAAYSLAGLEYISGSDSSITERGSMYVEAPQGMTLDVSLDGVFLGFTPLLIEDISFGLHLLEASFDDYLYRNEINIDNKNLIEIVADNNTLKGNLYIKIIPVPAEGYNLFLDHELYSAGLIKDLSIGKRFLRIESKDWIYEGFVEVSNGETKQLEIELNPAGILDLDIPDDAIIEIRNSKGTLLTVNKFPMTIEVGEYSLKIKHADYETYNNDFIIQQGKIESFKLNLIHTEAFIEKQKLKDLEIRLNSLLDRKKVIIKKRNDLNRIAWITASIGIIGITTAAISEYYLPGKISDLNDTNINYLSETDPSLAWDLWASIVDQKEEINLIRLIRTIGIITAGVAGVVDIGLLLYRPSTESVDYEIELLKGDQE